jgi:glycosyltransferase involved in cell wall biosynthesis
MTGPSLPSRSSGLGSTGEELRLKAGTSVVIPVRNGARFIAEAIGSVQAQLEPGDEILVVDDGSTDSTPRILAGISDPGLRVLAGGGRGVSAARNIGLAVARGSFIAFLDHDDIWPAGRHRMLLEVLNQDEKLDAAFGRILRRFEPGARVTAESKVEGHHAYWLVGSGLYRRRLLDRVGGFAEDMPMGEDFDFHARLVEAGMRSRLCEAHSLIRRHHDANTSNDHSRAVPWRLEFLRRKIARVRSSAGVKPGRD